MSKDDIIKVDLDNYTEEDKAFALKQAFENAKVFMAMLDGRKSMKEYMKCDIFPAQNMDFTPLISTQIEESLRLIIAQADKAVKKTSIFHSILQHCVAVQDADGITQGRLRWEMNMHSNHEWNINDKMCPHYHPLKDKYNQKYNNGTGK